MSGLEADLERIAFYGFNDGLTANFGLVMGVIGARVEHNFILISGLAGMIADALSMGSSSFLAAKSEQEVYANEIRMEREEIELMPEIETEELAMIYRLRGMKPLEISLSSFFSNDRSTSERVPFQGSGGSATAARISYQ